MRPEGDKLCQGCRRRNPTWYAPSEVWNFVIGGPGAKGDPGGVLCPGCFIVQAERAGLKPTAWIVAPEGLAEAGYLVVPRADFEAILTALDAFWVFVGNDPYTEERGAIARAEKRMRTALGSAS